VDITPHDLLNIKPDGLGIGECSAWIGSALKKAPFVVVRRAPQVGAHIPVGVRGSVRTERYACMVPMIHILTCIKPEMLAQSKSWRQNRRFSQEFLSALEVIDQVVGAYKLSWGPTGSVGFELGTGIAVVSPASDLDFLLRADSYLPPSLIGELYHEMQRVEVKLDIQLETPQGAVALTEYLSGKQPFLLRTLAGPRLFTQPRQMLWEEER